MALIDKFPCLNWRLVAFCLFLGDLSKELSKLVSVLGTEEDTSCGSNGTEEEQE